MNDDIYPNLANFYWDISPNIPKFKVLKCSYLRSELGDGLGAAQHRSAAAHIELHQLDHGTRTTLQVVSATLKDYFASVL